MMTDGLENSSKELTRRQIQELPRHQQDKHSWQFKFLGSDQDAFAEAVTRTGMRLLSYCVMPNHWDLMAWPEEDRQLLEFTWWLTLTNTQRWHTHRHSAASGHVYQGRFKSCPVKANAHFYTICRYVDRNALKANLVKSADDWQWSSLRRWWHASPAEKELLFPWPLPRNRSWVEHVNTPLTEAEYKALQHCVR